QNLETLGDLRHPTVGPQSGTKTWWTLVGSSGCPKLLQRCIPKYQRYSPGRGRATREQVTPPSLLRTLTPSLHPPIQAGAGPWTGPGAVNPRFPFSLCSPSSTSSSNNTSVFLHGTRRPTASCFILGIVGGTCSLAFLPPLSSISYIALFTTRTSPPPLPLVPFWVPGETGTSTEPTSRQISHPTLCFLVTGGYQPTPFVKGAIPSPSPARAPSSFVADSKAAFASPIPSTICCGSDRWAGLDKLGLHCYTLDTPRPSYRAGRGTHWVFLFGFRL
ncbi:hypothetical protein QBC44DRAFT_390817, partial [Cladorrhinum sp. PSN332]